MHYPDIEEARKHLAALQGVLEASGPKSNELLGTIELLFSSMARALPDVIYQHRVQELRFYARELVSSDDAAAWARPPLTAAEFLRVQIVKCLNVVDARLKTIHAIRRAGTEGRTFVARSR